MSSRLAAQELAHAGRELPESLVLEAGRDLVVVHQLGDLGVVQREADLAVRQDQHQIGLVKGGVFQALDVRGRHHRVLEASQADGPPTVHVHCVDLGHLDDAPVFQLVAYQTFECLHDYLRVECGQNLAKIAKQV